MVSRTVSFIGCALGVFVCYFYYGVLQERINRGTYVHNGVAERFNYVSVLVAIQCAVNCIYAVVLRRINVGSNAGKTNSNSGGDGGGSSSKSSTLSSAGDNTPLLYYACAALTYLLAMVCSNRALQWVNYPAQVVGKSCKPIPVMLLGVLVAGKRYPLQKYLFVSLIVVGVAVFMYRDSPATSASAAVDHGQHELQGQLLLLVSLLMDGVTAACQERIKQRFRTTSTSMMLNMNLFSALYAAGYLLLSGHLPATVSFLGRHQQLLWQLASFATASAVGQYFIYRLIVEFGPLPCSIVTTTRKFFTVLGSVFLFGNTLSVRQWLGATAVFAGLFLDAASAKSHANKTATTATTTTSSSSSSKNKAHKVE